MSDRVDAILTGVVLVGVAVVLFGSLVFGGSDGSVAPAQVPSRPLPAAPAW